MQIPAQFTMLMVIITIFCVFFTKIMWGTEYLFTIQTATLTIFLANVLHKNCQTFAYHCLTIYYKLGKTFTINMVYVTLFCMQSYLKKG